jgi:siderophore synthetase component
MYSLSQPSTFPSLISARLEAEERSRQVLLNCYCREVAHPEGQMTIGPLFGHNDWPMPIKMALQQHGGEAMQILLPQTDERLLTVVAFSSPTCNFRYRSTVFHKSLGKSWMPLEGEALAILLLRELSLKYAVPPNSDLMDQIRDSINVTTLTLSVPPPTIFSNDPVDAYIDSEQSLALGHPFHPAPKSRQGFSEEGLLRYSPEMRTRFKVHYFAVRREDISQQSLLTESCDQIVAKDAPQVEKDFVAVPVHPWQAGYLLEQPLLRRAIVNGRMRYLGEHGDDFFPTSSIRTLYQPGNPYFYKFSLNVRITNCVRKNAWYELESAMQISRIMRPFLNDLYRQFGGLRVLEEPAFMSVDLRDLDEEKNRQIIEGFGLILRQNVEDLLLPNTKPILAGALFGNHVYSECRTASLLESLAYSHRSPLNEATENWFDCYVKALMYPVFYLYFSHGLIFEPHLQNVVLGIQGGWPKQVFLRDFEGVKLVSERYSDNQLCEISTRARDSLWYSGDQGWNRIAYCLFVNNFCEAINQLAPENPVLQQRLWGVVRHRLQDYQAHYGDTTSFRRINDLVTGQPFPGKTNLINRFLKRPDREASYVPVINPIPMV